MYQQVEKAKGDKRKVINNSQDNFHVNNLFVNVFDIHTSPIKSSKQKKWLDLSHSARAYNKFQYFCLNKNTVIQAINKIRDKTAEYYRQAKLGKEKPDTTIDGNRQAIQHYERAIELRRAVANNYGHMGKKHALAIKVLEEEIRTRIMKISNILNK
jgi:hypothetical protein